MDELENNPGETGMCPHGNNPEECEVCQAEKQLEEEAAKE